MKHKDAILVIEVNGNGSRALLPVARIRSGVLIFDEAVPKGAVGRIVAEEPIRLEVRDDS